MKLNEFDEKPRRTMFEEVLTRSPEFIAKLAEKESSPKDFYGPLGGAIFACRALIAMGDNAPSDPPSREVLTPFEILMGMESEEVAYIAEGDDEAAIKAQAIIALGED